MSGDEEEGEAGPDVTARGERAKLQARLHLHGNMLERLHQIEEARFSEAELQKLFGRQEGLVAYRNILKAEGDYSGSLRRQSEAQRTELFHKVMTLPSTDPSLSAAKLARVGEAKKIESDMPLGTERNLFDAVVSEQYSQSSKFGKAFTNIMSPMARILPFGQEAVMRSALQQGELNAAPELRREVVQHFGGTESAFAGAGEQRRLYEVAEKLSQAADRLSAAAQAGGHAADKLHSAAELQRQRSPSLGPKRDPGDPH